MSSPITNIDLSSYDAKLVKAVLKEGGKKAQDVAGVADLGGLDFFCTTVDSAKGDVTLLRAAMDAMNAEVAPDAEERRGGAGHVGKVLISSSEKEAVAIVAYVPEDKQAKLDAKTWLEFISAAVKAEILEADSGLAYAVMKYDPENGRFPLKERDNAISHATLLLRQKGFMPDDDSDDDDDYVFGDDDFPSDEPEVSTAVEVVISPVDVSGYDAKLLKKVLKEGGKKAQDVAGVADLGGLDFFCTSIDSAEGDVTLLRAAMDAMNVECDPTAEERRGGAGHVGKVLVSSSEKKAVAIVACVPEDKQSKLDAKTWIEKIAGAIQADVIEASAGYAYAEMKYDPENGRFPLKERDNAICNATLLLRQMGLMPDDSDDDSDDYCYGDDDFE